MSSKTSKTSKTSKASKKEERMIRTESGYKEMRNDAEEYDQKYEDDFGKEYDHNNDYDYTYDLDEMDNQEERNMVIVNMDVSDEEETQSVGLPEEMGIMEEVETVELEHELPNYVENLREPPSMNDVVLEEIHDEDEWSDDRGETMGGNHLLQHPRQQQLQQQQQQQQQQQSPYFRIQSAQRMYTH